MQTVRTQNNGNRFIEQYEWTIRVCVTVQIGELGAFTDVQIGECGKQRVNEGKKKLLTIQDKYLKATCSFCYKMWREFLKNRKKMIM